MMTRRINRYRCSHCGCDDPIHNDIDGKLYCNNCGMRLENSSVTNRNKMDSAVERASDAVLEGIINDQGNVIAGSWNAIHYLLEELQARRKAEKEHGYTSHGTNGKDGAETTQEKPALPIPCTKGYEEWTVKQFFAKINEELDEVKDAILSIVELEWKPEGGTFEENDVNVIAEEAADTITAITSMLEAMGIDEQQRQAAQKLVNEHTRSVIGCEYI